MQTQGKFEHTPKGYLEAKDWLTYVVEWENITMTDPSFAPEYKKFLECCCHLLGWDKEEVHNMKCTNFWLFGFMEDFKTPKEAVEVFRAKKKEFGNDFPPKPEILTLSARDSRQLLDNLEILGKEKLIMKYEAEMEKEWSDEVKDAHEKENVDFCLMQFKLNLERLDRLEKEAMEMWQNYKHNTLVNSIDYLSVVQFCIAERSRMLWQLSQLEAKINLGFDKEKFDVSAQKYIQKLENPQKPSVQELLNIDIVENDGVKITKTA